MAERCSPRFSHFIDIMFWLFGDIKNIEGKFQDFTHAESTAFEDSGIVNFEFVDGGMGCINYSTAVWDSNLESRHDGCWIQGKCEDRRTVHE